MSEANLSPYARRALSALREGKVLMTYGNGDLIVYRQAAKDRGSSHYSPLRSAESFMRSVVNELIAGGFAERNAQGHIVLKTSK